VHTEINKDHLNSLEKDKASEELSQPPLQTVYRCIMRITITVKEVLNKTAG